MVEKIILEVLSGERVAVRVFESNNLFLFLLLVRSGCCSRHRRGGGGDTVVVVVNCQTCPNREGSDRRPLRSFHHSGNHEFVLDRSFLFLKSNPLSFFLRPSCFRFLVAPPHTTLFFVSFLLLAGIPSISLFTSQSDLNSLARFLVELVNHIILLICPRLLRLCLRTHSPSEHVLLRTCSDPQNDRCPRSLSRGQLPCVASGSSSRTQLPEVLRRPCYKL